MDAIVKIEHGKLYLYTIDGKTDIGFPIQNILDGMAPFLAELDKSGVVYVRAPGAPDYVWRPEEGWSRAINSGSGADQEPVENDPAYQMAQTIDELAMKYLEEQGTKK